jgi:hypothetical protein
MTIKIKNVEITLKNEDEYDKFIAYVMSKRRIGHYKFAWSDVTDTKDHAEEKP